MNYGIVLLLALFLVAFGKPDVTEPLSGTSQQPTPRMIVETTQPHGDASGVRSSYVDPPTSFSIAVTAIALDGVETNDQHLGWGLKPTRVLGPDYIQTDAQVTIMFDNYWIDRDDRSIVPVRLDQEIVLVQSPLHYKHIEALYQETELALISVDQEKTIWIFQPRTTGTIKLAIRKATCESCNFYKGIDAEVVLEVTP